MSDAKQSNATPLSVEAKAKLWDAENIPEEPKTELQQILEIVKEIQTYLYTNEEEDLPEENLPKRFKHMATGNFQRENVPTAAKRWYPQSALGPTPILRDRNRGQFSGLRVGGVHFPPEVDVGSIVDSNGAPTPRAGPIGWPGVHALQGPRSQNRMQDDI